MHLQNGYGVSDLLPQDTPISLSTNFPIPPPPPNLDSSQQPPPHQFQLFWQHQHPHHQQQHSVVVDPNFASNFRVGVDQHHHNSAGTAFPHNLIGLVGGGSLTPTYRPPPSVVVAPQPLRWINQEDPLWYWKCDQQFEIERYNKSETQIPPSLLQFRDPEIDKQFSQSPGSVSEIYETHWPNPENDHMVKKERKKKKNNSKCCTDSEEEEKLERELKVMASIIEGKLVAHQERLHSRFTAAIERMDKERRVREESWRAADAETARVQAAARARGQALAASREAVIVSYLERISGEKIDLLRGKLGDQESMTGECKGRWPREEVEALIGARSGMETRFQEPGMKAGLWEEVSRVMEGIGFRRSAKRCKEKWENINKYFRKVREEDDHKPGKRLKTCSYFDKLDEYYSSSRAIAMDSTTPNSCSYNNDDDKGEKNELLEVMLEFQSKGLAHQLDDDCMNVIENEDEVSNGGEQQEDCDDDDGDYNNE